MTNSADIIKTNVSIKVLKTFIFGKSFTNVILVNF